MKEQLWYAGVYPCPQMSLLSLSFCLQDSWKDDDVEAVVCDNKGLDSFCENRGQSFSESEIIVQYIWSES